MTILRVVEPSADTAPSATHPTHRRGEVGHLLGASGILRDRWVCGTDSSMALQVPCCSGTVRQKGVLNYIGLLQLACALTVVPSPMATMPF